MLCGICVCVHVCGRAYAPEVYTQRLEEESGVFLHHSTPYVFGKGSLTEPDTCGLGWATGQGPRGIYVLLCHSAEAEACVVTQGFHVGVGELNSDSLLQAANGLT